jgi:zinc transport system substrate-binding protein
MRKIAYMLTAGILIFGFLGCTSAPASSGSTSSPAAPAAGSLGQWAGTWNNFYSYLEFPAIQEAYSILAVKEGKTAEEIKRRYLDGLTYQCEIAAFRVTASSITFFTGPQTSANATSNVAYAAAYSDAGPVDIGGRIWQHFETSSNIPYKHLLLLPAEADEPGKTMVHFHFRYGQSLENLKNAEGWFPTMVQYDNSSSLIVGHMTH